MMKKKILCLILGAALLTGCDMPAIGAQNTDNPAEEDLVNITFIAINDLHGKIRQNKQGTGGLSNTKYLIDSMSQFFEDDDVTTTERDDIVLFANGDMFTGDAVCYSNFGEPVIMAMNEMGFDGMGIGNHEFDRRLDSVTPYFSDADEFGDNRGNESDVKADFPLVSSNIEMLNTDGSGELIADLSDDDNIVPSLLVEKMGVKIGIIAVIGPLGDHIGRKMNNYSIDDVGESVKKAAVDLKSQGAELIAANMHYSESDNAVTCEENLAIANVSDNGEYLIDMIFDGHTHEEYCEYIERDDGSEVPVIQGASKNRAISYVTVTYDRANRKTVAMDCDTMSTEYAKDNYDENVEKIIDDYYAKNSKKYFSPICNSEITLIDDDDYDEYACNLMLEATGADYAYGDPSCYNDAKPIYEGDEISKAMLFEYYPYDDYVAVLSIKGSYLYKLSQKWKYAGDFYGKDGGDLSSLEGSDDVVTVALVDYTMDKFEKQLSGSDVTGKEVTDMLIRDLIIEDFEEMK